MYTYTMCPQKQLIERSLEPVQAVVCKHFFSSDYRPSHHPVKCIPVSRSLQVRSRDDVTMINSVSRSGHFDASSTRPIVDSVPLQLLGQQFLTSIRTLKFLPHPQFL
ncbi:hypothetical protein Hypma_002045 [Hypsizygus marmoreus]|uniref:Uncharacterized protein n=1 Tax=Hypsizygus marmoreus TaxID=39966 RepID=A0A369J8S1_HYPMA|nr:hypothetical protein Hypma_002045 [Hypsizygus marmoreus]